MRYRDAPLPPPTHTVTVPAHGTRRRIAIGATLASVAIACYWFGEGYPTAIYSDKKRTKLVGAFGVTY